MSDWRVDDAEAALGTYLRSADEGDEQSFEGYLERRGALATDLLWDLVHRCPIEVQTAIRAMSADRPMQD